MRIERKVLFLMFSPEVHKGPGDADIFWKLDMMKELRSLFSKPEENCREFHESSRKPHRMARIKGDNSS